MGKKKSMKGTKLRLVNFLIDTIIYFVLLIIFVQVFRDFIDVKNVKWISALFYFSYYFILEYFTGQTIAKILTKSKTISATENNEYFLIRIIIRTLVRFIPFDILSYIFTSRGLHDIFSKTKVINTTSKDQYNN